MRNRSSADLRRAGSRVLVDALSGWPKRPPAPRGELLAATDFDWLARAARYHGVQPALYTYLQNSPETPREVLAGLRRAHTGQVVRHLQVMADIRRLAAGFEATQIPWVAVKGPVLAELYWGRPDLRQYSDLDIVVDPSALSSVLDILNGLGARLIDVNWAMILRRMRGELSVELPGGTALDLHWHVVNEREIRDRLGFRIDEMLARRRMVTIGSIQAPTWDAADTLLHTAFHCAASGGHRLVWIKDVHTTASAADLDWDVVARRAGEFRVGLLLGAVLKRAARVFGPLPIPREIESHLGKGSPWLAMTALVDRVAPPAVLPWRGPSGRAAYQCIRDSTPATLRAFAQNVPIVVRARRTGASEATEENLLHAADGNENAKLAYLRLVGAGAHS
jgi:Uncharacterised nucleotidyltransferase